eukprot:5234119-Alexandrium_andersonii.AAC.1
MLRSGCLARAIPRIYQHRVQFDVDSKSCWCVDGTLFSSGQISCLSSDMAHFHGSTAIRMRFGSGEAEI